MSQGGSVRLRILGCSGTYPTCGTPSSGYVIEDPTATVWMDCGTGTFPVMQQAASCDAVDALVISHVHSDHCLDIYPLYYARRFNPECERLPVYCPAGTEEHLGSFLIGDGACKLGFIFDFREVHEGDVIEVGGIRMEFMLTDHPIPTHAIRAESPTGTLTYSADTGPGADMASFAHGSDAFLCESSYQSGDLGPPLHLSTHQAADFAKRAEVGNLILTHFWPTHDRLRSVQEAAEVVGDIPVTGAHPGGVFDIRLGRWV